MKLLFEHFEMLINAPEGIKKMRELILQLAVQGKLVPQDPKDEPASVLLEKIKAEKEKLIKEGKIKAQKPLPKIKEEEKPFELPEGWEWVKLNELTEINGGFAFKSSNYSVGGVRVIRISDFDENGFVDKNIVRHSFTTALEQFELKESNIIIAMTGGTVGKSLLVKMLEEPMFVNQRVAKIEVNKNVTEKYIYSVVRSELIQKIIHKKKNSTNDNISMQDIQSFPIPLPPLNEQKRVVAKVDQLMALCDELEKQKEKADHKKHSLNKASLFHLLNAENQKSFTTYWQQITSNFDLLFSTPESVKDLKQAILQLAVQGKLVPQDPKDEPASVLLKKIKSEKDKMIKEGKIKAQKPLAEIIEEEKPFELPEGWEWVRLEDLCKTITQGPNPKYNSILSEKYRVLKTKDFYDDVIYYARTEKISKEIFEEFERYQLVDEDLIYGLVGKGSTAKCNIFKEQPNLKMIFTRATGLIRLVDSHLVLASLVKLFFTSTHGKATSESITDGSTGQLVIKTSELKKVLFPLPPLNEQKRIVTKVDQLMALCDELEKALSHSSHKSQEILNSIVSQVGKA